MKAMGTTHKSQQRSQSTPQAWKHIKTWNCNLLQSHCVFFRNVLNVCLQKKRHLACTDCHAIWLQKKTNHDAYVWNTFTRTIGSLDLQSKVVAQCQPWPRVIQHQTGLCNSIRKKPSHETSSNQWIHCWLVDCPVFSAWRWHWANDLLMVVEEEEEQKPSLEQSLNIIAWAFLPCIIPLPIWHATCIHGLNPWTNCTRHAHPANFTPPNQTQSLE